MLTRRAFTRYLLCSTSGIFGSGAEARSHPLVFCASAIDPADAKFYALHEVDWASFWLNEVPEIYSACCRAYGIAQEVFFSDELPVQASWNSVHSDDPSRPRMYIGVGNLEAYPFSTLIAVILHELGHIFCFRAKNYKKIVSNSVRRQRELLADVIAGAVFAKMEGLGIATKESVQAQCSVIELPWEESSMAMGGSFSGPKKNGMKLNSRRLLEIRMSAPAFKVLRPNGKVETIENYGMIGETPQEGPHQSRCVTVHRRSVDFVAMVAAVSSWRTFGDLPDEGESHGSPSERYNAFSFGYKMFKSRRQSLNQCLAAGIEYVGIRYV